MSEILSTIGMTFTILGVFLIAVPMRLGFWFTALANSAWILYAVNNDVTQLAVQGTVLLCFNIFGIISWYKKGIG